MGQKKNVYSSEIDSKKYFRSPLFLIVAILVTLIPVVIIARMLISGIGIVLSLGLIFAVISAVYVWIVYAGKSEIKKVKKVCRILSYTRFLSTLITVVFISLASILVIGLLVGLVSEGEGLGNIADTLEHEVQPFFETMTSGEIDEFVDTTVGSLNGEALMTRGFWLGVNDVDDLKMFMKRWNTVLAAFNYVAEDAIELARNSYALFVVLTAALCALVAAAMCFVNSALKKAVLQMQILSVGVNGFKRSCGFALYSGGTALVAVGLVMIFLDPVLAIVPVLLGAVMYVLAWIFEDVKHDKAYEEAVFKNAYEIEEAAKMTVTNY